MRERGEGSSEVEEDRCRPICPETRKSHLRVNVDQIEEHGTAREATSLTFRDGRREHGLNPQPRRIREQTVVRVDDGQRVNIRRRMVLELTLPLR